jgi:hypothetical protein
MTKTKEEKETEARMHKDISTEPRMAKERVYGPVPMIEKERDIINHPPHYADRKYEPIDVIEDWDLKFNLGNTIKYIARCDLKGNDIEDLEKALWYLKREINRRKRYGKTLGN